MTRRKVLWAVSARRDLVLAVVDARRSLEDALLDRLIWIEGQEQ